MGLYRKRTVASAEGRLSNGQAAVGVGHDHHRIIFHFQTRGYLVIPCRHRLRHAHEVLNGVHGMCAQVDERSSTALLHAEKMWGQPLIDGAGMCNVGSQQGNLSEPTFFVQRLQAFQGVPVCICTENDRCVMGTIMEVCADYLSFNNGGHLEIIPLSQITRVSLAPHP
jgi:hypothetical protein